MNVFTLSLRENFRWGLIYFYKFRYIHLSYDIASGSEITPCIKVHKPLVVYRFLGNIMK